MRAQAMPPASRLSKAWRDGVKPALSWALLGLCCLWLAGCASNHYPVNVPLAAATGQTAPPYDLKYLNNSDNSWSLFMHLSLSGGGTRAAAMSYGVLEELAATRLRWEKTERTLFDEVDVVSGVSGGSITGAYLAAAGPKFLQEFPKRFLYQDFQGQLISRLATPGTAWKLTSPRYGRSEVIAEMLDEHLFEGRTFSSLREAGRRPLFIASATDITDGARFEFTQAQFDLLCSDMNPFPLSRAVAASMAVPIVFSPVTLWKHNANCPRAETVAAPGHKKAFTHLLDGGLADNLGVRSPLVFVDSLGGMKSAIRSTRSDVRKVVYLIVNAFTDPQFPEDQSANIPGLLRSVAAVSDIPINRFSRESSRQMHSAVERWREELQKQPFASGDSPADIYLIEVNFNSIADPKARDYLLSLPTSLSLTREQVDAVRRAAAAQLRAAPEYQRLLRDLGAVPAP
jgi:NTE family protein